MGAGRNLGTAYGGIGPERLSTPTVDLDVVTIRVELHAGGGGDNFQRAGAGPSQVFSAAADADQRHDNQG
jgi:hypothetical protein